MQPCCPCRELLSPILMGTGAFRAEERARNIRARGSLVATRRCWLRAASGRVVHLTPVSPIRAKFYVLGERNCPRFIMSSLFFFAIRYGYFLFLFRRWKSRALRGDFLQAYFWERFIVNSFTYSPSLRYVLAREIFVCANIACSNAHWGCKRSDLTCGLNIRWRKNY